MGIQGDESSFFASNLKVCPRPICLKIKNLSQTGPKHTTNFENINNSAMKDTDNTKEITNKNVDSNKQTRESNEKDVRRKEKIIHNVSKNCKNTPLRRFRKTIKPI